MTSRGLVEVPGARVHRPHFQEAGIQERHLVAAITIVWRESRGFNGTILGAGEHG